MEEMIVGITTIAVWASIFYILIFKSIRERKVGNDSRDKIKKSPQLRSSRFEASKAKNRRQVG